MKDNYCKRLGGWDFTAIPIKITCMGYIIHKEFWHDEVFKFQILNIKYIAGRQQNI